MRPASRARRRDRAHRRRPPALEAGRPGGRQQRPQDRAPVGRTGSTAAAASTASTSPSRLRRQGRPRSAAPSSVVRAITHDHCAADPRRLGLQGRAGRDRGGAPAPDADVRELRAGRPTSRSAATPRSCASGPNNDMLDERVRAVHDASADTARRADRRRHRRPARGSARRSARPRTLAGIDMTALEFKRDSARPAAAAEELLAAQARRARDRRRSLHAGAHARDHTGARSRLQGRHRARLGLRRRRVLEGHGQARRGHHLADVLGRRRCA